MNGSLQLRQLVHQVGPYLYASFSKARSLSSLGLTTFWVISVLKLAQMAGLLMKLDFDGFRSSLFHQQLLVQKWDINFWFLTAMVVIWHQNLMNFAIKMILFQFVCQHIHHTFHSHLISAIKEVVASLLPAYLLITVYSPALRLRLQSIIIRMFFRSWFMQSVLQPQWWPGFI